MGGRTAGVGESSHPFTIQSIAKPFVFALVCEALGSRDVRERLGVNATGLPFDAVMAVEQATEGLTNPMVNSGPLDAAGNSVRGQLATKLLSAALGLDLLASSDRVGTASTGT